MKHAIKKSSVEDCVRIKNLATVLPIRFACMARNLRLFPIRFPDGNGVSVQVTSEAEPTKRTMRLPTSS